MKIVKCLIGVVIGVFAIGLLISQIGFLVDGITHKEKIAIWISRSAIIIGAVAGGLLLSKAKWWIILILLVALVICITIMPIPIV